MNSVSPEAHSAHMAVAKGHACFASALHNTGASPDAGAVCFTALAWQNVEGHASAVTKPHPGRSSSSITQHQTELA